jgi:predicted nucleic acid-binding Zn ribbon protein
MKRLSDVFESLTKSDPLFKNLKLRLVLSDLAGILGESLAKHCRFVEFSNGTVFFTCDSNVWLTEARFMSKKIAEKINERLGERMVNNVVFRRDPNGDRL